SFRRTHWTCLSALVRRPRDGSVVSFLHCMNDPQPEGHMASYIGRRKFLGTLGGAAAWPLAARAQQAERMRRIGWLAGGLAANDPERRARAEAFVKALRELGWSEGHNMRIEYRWGAANVDNNRKQAAELIALAPDVVLASASGSVHALQ